MLGTWHFLSTWSLFRGHVKFGGYFSMFFCIHMFVSAGNVGKLCFSFCVCVKNQFRMTSKKNTLQANSVWSFCGQIDVGANLRPHFHTLCSRNHRCIDGYIWPNENISPTYRFPWYWGISFPPLPFWGEVVWGRYNLIRHMTNSHVSLTP